MEEKQFKEINRLLTSILTLLVIENYERLSEILLKVIDSDQKINAYTLTDGINSSTDIAKKVDVVQQTISKWWTEWENYGLVVPGKIRADRPQKSILFDVFLKLKKNWFQ